MAGVRSFLLLHGFGNHRPPEHWMHWLAGRLEARGDRVLYPQLPDPDEPRLEAWLATLGKNLDTLAASGTDRDGNDDGGGGGGERIVVCHSLSCLLWFHAAPGLAPAHRPDRVVLVSPPGNTWVPEPGAGFRLEAINAPALRASARVEVRIVCSDADPYNPPGTVSVYGEPLGVVCDLLPGGGHISADDGFGPWPAMLAWCEAPGGPVTPR